jgi:hypothetical protein
MIGSFLLDRINNIRVLFLDSFISSVPPTAPFHIRQPNSTSVIIHYCMLLLLVPLDY